MLNRAIQSSFFPEKSESLSGEWLRSQSGGVTIENEFWTARQRQSCSLHEVSYRACFKPLLPNFFITRLTVPGDVVYDPFSGRGTTAVEAAILGRRVALNDVNPLSGILAKPRLMPPSLPEIRARLDELELHVNAGEVDDSIDWRPFYHEETYAELCKLREYLRQRKALNEEDSADEWIRMVATNRLTGHSPGFFSGYTLPPNQAISPARQRKINATREQTPPYRDVAAIILKKSKQLLSGLDEKTRKQMLALAKDALLMTGRAQEAAIPEGHVSLTVTSPPFLDVVQYKDDNWLRCWFNYIDVENVANRMSVSRSIDVWEAEMGACLENLYRATRRGGYVAFEVGEVRNGKIKLDEHVIPLGKAAGFTFCATLINRQDFTKTANIWGVKNNAGGTNTNRIVLLRKD